MKYVFKQIDDISRANAVTTLEFSADTLSTVLEQFELFLKGSGFQFDGNLDVINLDDGFDEFEPAEEHYEDEEGYLSQPESAEEHEWTKTLRDDVEFPFPIKRPEETPWPGVAPSVSAQYTVTPLKGSDAN